MSKAFAGILAKKVSSNVLVVEGSVKNYLRVRVAYPLDEPLKSTVEVKVKGSGTMSFDVRYENVSFFCFACGRMGHSKKECPDDGEESDDEGTTKVKKFGDWLRRSPQKKGVDAARPAWNAPEAGRACGQDEARWRRWTHTGPGCSERCRRSDASAATHRGPQVRRPALHCRARR